MKTVCWISGGVSSFIAGYLMRDEIDEFIFIDIDDHHEDTYRFLKDCEKALNKPITILRSEKYKSVDQVMLTGFISSPYGAKCTTEMKTKVRLAYEKEQKGEVLRYVWGFDSTETKRADKLASNFFEYVHVFPLIDKQLTKYQSHVKLSKMGIKRPKMYDLGYSNNNCIGCVKGGKGYWNKIRKDFPEVFELRARRERELGCTVLNGRFLDELKENEGEGTEKLYECGILCSWDSEEEKEKRNEIRKEVWNRFLKTKWKSKEG